MLFGNAVTMAVPDLGDDYDPDDPEEVDHEEPMGGSPSHGPSYTCIDDPGSTTEEDDEDLLPEYHYAGACLPEGDVMPTSQKTRTTPVR